MARGIHGKQGVVPSPDGTRGMLSAGEWTVLPAEGRNGDVPRWPLPAATIKPPKWWPEMTMEKLRSELKQLAAVRQARERQVWAELWKTPQAIMWEQHGQEHEVALYVRLLVEAEVSDAPVTTRAEARRFMEALGLSVPGLFRNRWRIDPEPTEDTTPTADENTAAARKPGSARDRLRVVGEDT